MAYSKMDSKHFFIYLQLYGIGHNIMVKNTKIMKEETCCQQLIGYFFLLEAMDLLYVPSHNQGSTYLGI